MNTTNNRQKQIGDRVKITAGQYKDLEGTLAAKDRRGWTIDLEDGSNVTVGFPMVVLIEVPEVESTGEQTPEAVEIGTEHANTQAVEAEETTTNEMTAEDTTASSVVETTAEDATLKVVEIENQTEDSFSADGESASPAESSTDDDSPTDETSSPATSADIAKMTVKQLQDLAKQRGIGIARTKPDFLRIIKDKNPDEDLDQLTGKTLFNRVSELHISRLRTKDDLVRMLNQ